jgi:hypothetical protein
MVYLLFKPHSLQESIFSLKHVSYDHIRVFWMAFLKIQQLRGFSKLPYLKDKEIDVFSLVFFTQYFI